MLRGDLHSPLGLVRRRLADRGDGVHRDRARPRVPGAHRPLAPAPRRQRAERRAAAGSSSASSTRSTSTCHPGERAASPCSRASRSTSSTTAASTRPTRCSTSSTSGSPASTPSWPWTRRDMTRRMVAAVRNPRVNVLGHCTGRMVMGARGHPQAVPVRRQGGLHRLRRERHRGRDQLPARAPRPADQAARARPRPRLPVLDRLRRPRPGPARLPLVRRGAGRGRRDRPRPDRQHLAQGAAAGVGEPSGRLPALDSGMAVASEPAPEVEVRRSKRRRRTVSAYRDGEKIVVLSRPH